MFRDTFELLCEEVAKLRHHVHTTATQIGIDWQIVFGQQSDPLYEPCRSFRCIDHQTHRYQTVADPVRIHRGIDRLLASGARSQQFRTFQSPQDLKQAESSRWAMERFRRIVTAWAIPRHQWEPILGVDTEDIYQALDGNLVLFEGSLTEARIKCLEVIREVFRTEGVGYAYQRAYLRWPNPEMGHQSLLAMLMKGALEPS